MKESKIIRLLRKLDKAEVKRLRDFINSPYYNKNAKYSQVFEELIKYHPDFDSSEFSEENIYKKSLGAKDYDYFTMKNILSDLNDLALKFLLTEHKSERLLADEIKLLEQLREREVFDEYKKRLNKLKKKLEENPGNSEFYFEDKLRLVGEEISSLSIFDPNTRFDLKQVEMDSLANLSTLRLLKAYCALFHELKQNNYPFKFTLMDDIKNYILTHSFEDIPLLNLYKNIFFLQLTGEYKYYKILKEIRDKYFDELHRGDMYMLFVYMRSYSAVSYSEKMDRKYLRDCFELDKFMFEKGRTALGKLLYPDFIATIKTAASVGEYDWCEDFMDKMEDELMDDAKEDTLNFSRGFIEYRKGNLSEALELIYKSSFNIFIMQIQVYVILMRIYYEIGYYEDALNLAKTANGYLKKEIALDQMKNELKRFFDYTSEMAKLKTSVLDKDDIQFKQQQLSAKIEKMKLNYFGIINWLKEQVKNV